MDGEAIPDFCGHFRAEEIRQGLPAMDVEVVHYQVDGFRFRVLHGQLADHLGELESRAIRGGKGEMPAGFRFYGAENIGGTAALVLIVPPRFASRLGWGGGPNIGVQRDRLLIQAHHRFGGSARFFVRLQHVFHFGDVLVIEFRHGRGRDAGCPAPPRTDPRMENYLTL